LNHHDFYYRDRWLALPSQRQGNRNGAKRAEFARLATERPRHVFPIAWIETAKREDPLSPLPPEFDRDEVLVCMALAFCLAGASTSIVYRLLG
jgi:hypothetical protein